MPKRFYSLNQSETESFKLNINNKYGTIKWTNINEIDLIIPLTLSLKLKKAYGLFFTDVWNFYIDIEELGIVPNNSFVLVDIFQNSEKKVAKCQLPQNGEKTIFCHLEGNNQKRTDIIKINTEFNLGSIIWINNNTELMEAFTIYQNISNTTYFFVEDAYDLKYEIDIWKFKIRGLPERKFNKGEIFL